MKLFALFALCALLVAAPAPAAGWLPPQNLSPTPSQATDPQVAVDSGGNAIAIWSRGGVIEAAVGPAGGPWGASETLSAAGGDARGPRVAIDAAGNALAVWDRSNGTNRVVQTSYRPAGGAWGDPEDLFERGAAAQVAFDAAGNATVVWTGFDGTDDFIYTATRTPEGSWTTPEPISDPEDTAAEPELAVNASGTAAAVWQRDDGANNVIAAAVRPAGGSWSAPENLSASGRDADDPRVVVAPAGTVIAAWHRDDGTAPVVQAIDYSSGAWGDVEDISAAGEYTEGVRLAVDGVGNVVAVYTPGLTASEIRTDAAFRPAAGDWEPPVVIAAAGPGHYSPTVEFDPNGNALALWSTGTEPQRTLKSALRPAGGVWQPGPNPTPPGGESHPAELDFDGAGNAISVFVYREPGVSGIIRTVAYDATPPVIQAVNTPAAGFARQALTFSIDASDLWSSPGTPTWAFGDGTSATGATVTHTYARGGTYAVTVTQPDVVGNSSSATRTLTLRTATCFGTAATKVGTAGADVLQGTRRADVIVALGGNDRVRGGRGNDKLCGGAGRDRLLGEGGNDRLNGGPGRDVCRQGIGRGRLVAC